MVLVFHGAELLLSKRFPFVNPVLKFFIKRSEALLCNSSYTAGQLRKITNKKVNIIPYGCSIDVKEGVETESTENESEVPEKHILFVGRLIERKGLPYLIRAMDSIVKQRPHDRIMLHIVGTGPEQCMVDELVASLKLSPHIVFHGVVSDEDLVSLYRSADVFVLPSIMDKKGDTEGLGVVLVEAMSFLTPVVASDVGGISDVVISEKTGMLVPEKAPQALAEAIIKILDDESFAKELTENALSHVQGYFDWQRIVNEVIKISKEAQCGLEMSR